MQDFNRKTLAALTRKGIKVLSTVAIPDNSSSMPWANAIRGYNISDNGLGRVVTFSQVLKLAEVQS